MKTISENIYSNTLNSQINSDISFNEKFVDNISSESIIEEFTNSDDESEEEFTDSEEEFTDSEEEFTDSDIIENFARRRKKPKKRKVKKPKKKKPKKNRKKNKRKKKKRKKKKKSKKKKSKKKKSKKKKSKKKKSKKQRAKEIAGKVGSTVVGVGGAVALGVGMVALPQLLSKDGESTSDSVLASTGNLISGTKGTLDKVGKSVTEIPTSTTSNSDSDASKIGKDEILKNGKIIKKNPTQFDFDKIIKDEIKKIEAKKKLKKSSLSDKENMLLTNSFDRITKHLKMPLIIIAIVFLLHIILPIIFNLFLSSGEAMDGANDAEYQ